MSSSRNCLTVHATGGEVANHLCMRESWSDPMVELVEVPWYSVREGYRGYYSSEKEMMRCDALQGKKK
jgi:hypothetical protein